MSDTKREIDKKNREAFESMLPKLKALQGKYFLMRRGKIINHYDTLNAAHSTGLAVYDDKDFSVHLLKAPKETKAKKAKGKKPTKYDVPGYVPGYPDQSPTHFEVVAEQLHIRPFYTGPGSLPFKCLMGEPTWTTIYSGNPSKAKTGWYNGYRLTDACIAGHI